MHVQELLPQSGSMVLFDSKRVWHEVLPHLRPLRYSEPHPHPYPLPYPYPYPYPHPNPTPNPGAPDPSQPNP